MPFTFTQEAREKAIERVLDGLATGTPLTVICRAEGMPADNTVRMWAQSDPDLADAIARARDAGWDAIAVEALRIADTPLKGQRVKVTADGKEIVTEDMLGHRKLQVETRLKLLAKWDPKRYGELLKHGNADGGNLDFVAAIAAGNARVGDVAE